MWIGLKRKGGDFKTGYFFPVPVAAWKQKRKIVITICVYLYSQINLLFVFNGICKLTRHGNQSTFHSINIDCFLKYKLIASVYLVFSNVLIVCKLKNFYMTHQSLLFSFVGLFDWCLCSTQTRCVSKKLH